MRTVFADTFYWFGFASRSDPWHTRVLQVKAQLDSVHLVTTDEVLIEFLASMSGGGAFLRQIAVELVDSILADKTVQVLPQTRASFLRGLDLYARRSDKEYSLWIVSP